jgi:hypothetical protein
LGYENLPFHIGDRVLIIKHEDILRGFCGKIVSHISTVLDTPKVKVRFEFKKGDTKPVPKGYATKASNIQFRIFDVKDLIVDSKLNRLLYG